MRFTSASAFASRTRMSASFTCGASASGLRRRGLRASPPTAPGVLFRRQVRYSRRPMAGADPSVRVGPLSDVLIGFPKIRRHGGVSQIAQRTLLSCTEGSEEDSCRSFLAI